jgi:hypothetical protein
MEQIFQKMLEKAVKDLNTLQSHKLLSFKVVTAEGGEYGDLVTKKAKKFKAKTSRTRGPAKYPAGELRNYIMPFVESLKPDQIVSIPTGTFLPEVVRGNVCAWCSKVWGKGTYSSTYNKTTKAVEIYRHAS